MRKSFTRSFAANRSKTIYKKIQRLLLHNHIALISLSYIAGLLLANKSQGLVLYVFALFFCTKSFKRSVLGAICLIFAALYVSWWNSQLTREHELLPRTLYEYRATVYEKPAIAQYDTTIVLNIDAYKGHAIAKIPKYPQYQYMDTIIIEGTLEPIEDVIENDSYKAYLISKQVYYSIEPKGISLIHRNSSFNSVLSSVHNSLIEKSNQYLHEPMAGLLNGIVLGTKQNLSEDLNTSLLKTGTSHIVSASGFNVVVIYTAAGLLAGMLHRKLVLIIGLVGIFLYVGMVGWYNLPALRAGVLLSYILVNKLLGRPHDYITATLLSCLILLLNYPFYIFNISFQLSVAATSGLFVFAEKMQRFLTLKIKKGAVFIEILSTTIAVSITTIPLSFSLFGTFSLVALLANVLVLPLIGIITIAGLYAMLIAQFESIISPYVFFIIEKALEYLIKVVTSISSVPFASQENSLVAYCFIGMCLLFYVSIDYQTYKYDITKNT